jgi:hypothetical protein
MANPNKLGLVFAAVIGGWHLCWVVLVVLGWAQRIIDFIFWAHMIQPVYVIKAFDPVAAITLIIITGGTGYVFGYVGAVVWNKLHRA